MCFWLRLLSVAVVLCPCVAVADVLPPGHKSVNHELLFVDSDVLRESRLIAAPIAGFQGVAVIKPGERFSFSSKYGTKFYLVPNDMPMPSDFDREHFEAWPNGAPPVHEISSVPWTSSVSSVLTVLKLESTSESGPVIAVVEHTELDSSGKPADTKWSWTIVAASVVIGLALCMVARRWFWRIYSVR
ncbi:MAG: hypothetical protein JNL67_08760 [Planctomycetaceae bacterium]|nr:hypothetical protein [Planctomycetaceae bacterium]